MMKGMIADIQRASFHDGDGIRTTVFLKGCPLRCRWCHNPECISFEKQVLRYPERCIGCGMCAQGCYSGAQVVCGREMDADQVLAEITPDIPYYTAGGGVTVSGGEPLAQREFLREFICLCGERGIRCAVETSLIYYDEALFKRLDFVMADLKIWDDATHRQYTGVSNKAIKEHFKQLNTLGVPMIARTPVIPGIDQDIKRISGFLNELENVKKYELLPYHPLGESKRIALGTPAAGFEIPTREYMKEMEKYAYIR